MGLQESQRVVSETLGVADAACSQLAAARS